uniref:N-acetyltransferase domain-containing protein n=1 Tax=Xenopus tropicalis TaxID=8364 RepID=A0A6I8Q2S3_XENTR
LVCYIICTICLDSDYESVIDLYVSGVMENAPVAFKQLLGFPSTQLLLAVGFLLSLAATGSILLPTCIVLCALAFLWWCCRDFFCFYVTNALVTDMRDIRKHYIEMDGHCFWVAESAGEVVGMVAALPFLHPGGEKYVELKRMSVAKSHRGMGIAKDLCRTSIDFACKRGCDGVVLTTSTGQVGGWNLYEKTGFIRTHSSSPPNWSTRLSGIKLLHYQYNIKRGGQ